MNVTRLLASDLLASNSSSVIPKTSSGLETFRRNDGSEKLREVKDYDYSSEVLDFLEELGAIDDSEDTS